MDSGRKELEGNLHNKADSKRKIPCQCTTTGRGEHTDSEKSHSRMNPSTHGTDLVIRILRFTNPDEPKHTWDRQVARNLTTFTTGGEPRHTVTSRGQLVPGSMKLSPPMDTLFRQMPGNPVKFGRCLKELERIYGIQHGGDRRSNPQNADLKTEEDLASQFGLSVDTLSRSQVP